ncbi:MAG: hypothetical protein MMC23_002738 [Stictis urceolatum]|nr:hypothetical protein [Stictis urceolata]
MSSSARTIQCTSVPGTTCSYRVPYSLSHSKPTIISIHSFATDGTLYRPQYEDPAFQDAVNFVAIDLLGHGGTQTEGYEWDYWDSAKMALEVLDRIGVQSAFAMGTSQGGWIVVRMALLAPEKIRGLIPIGTSLAPETKHTMDLGCWDGQGGLTPLVEGFDSAEPTPEWSPPDDFISFLMSVGFGQFLEDDEREYWAKKIRSTYAGDEGRRKLQHAVQVLRDREGLEERLAEVKCPVLWLHGSADEVFSVSNAEEGMEGLRKGGGEKRFEVVDGGVHFLGATHSKVVNENTLEFVERFK